jgi:DNA polymerase-4
MGLDEAGLHDWEPAKSMGKEHTFARDVEDRAEAESTLATLAEKVCRRLRRDGLAARTLTVKIRYSDFQTVSRACTLPHAVQYDSVVIPAAWELFRRLDTRRLGIRLVGVTASKLQPAVRQRSLFEEAAERKRDRLYQSVDAIRDRYGFTALTVASRMEAWG